jgi:Phage integrase family
VHDNLKIVCQANSNNLLQKAREVLSCLPPLPSSVRYYDDFTDAMKSVSNLTKNDVWLLDNDGGKETISFLSANQFYRPLLKHLVVASLSNSLDSDTIIKYIISISAVVNKFSVELDVIGLAVILSPFDFRSLWVARITTEISAHQAVAFRALLQLLCEMSIGEWLPGHSDFISKLPAATVDSYREVRTGDCFVPIDDQSLIIIYIDNMVEQLASNSQSLSVEELRDVCILIIAFQYAFRRGQIARIRDADVRIYSHGSVHFGALLSKKWNVKDRRKVNRAIKRDWCPLFIRYIEIKSSITNTLPTFFGVTPGQLGQIVGRLTKQITGTSWMPNDLRHTAAQRMADAGVSRVSLAEFMGHTSLRTGQVYYDTSPTQAQHINDALAISPIYSKIAEIALTKVFDINALMNLPDDNQIGGVPHGYPISGIGGCEIGQSNCQKNPILSCYECRKFLPLNDPDIHRSVVKDMREVVLKFAEASRGDVIAPAYTQLRRMLSAAIQIADGIEKLNSSDIKKSGGDNEPIL